MPDIKLKIDAESVNSVTLDDMVMLQEVMEGQFKMRELRDFFCRFAATEKDREAIGKLPVAELVPWTVRLVAEIDAFVGEQSSPPAPGD